MITATAELAAACTRLADHPFVTVDTEFLRETTYYSKLCIIQMASADEAVIIDTLAPDLDLTPFFDLMANAAVMKVFHAARQDVEIIWHRAGMVPTPMFDTQVAAMVLGHGEQVAYDQLVQRICQVQIDKSHRFTDWARRPLSAEQMDYAISDVTHLRKVYERLAGDLAKRGRSDWVTEEMAVLTSPDTYRVDPERSWERVKARIRKPRELAVLIEVSAWREREAQTRDVPRQRVIKDEVIAEIATQAPTTTDKLSQLRALPRGFERSAMGSEIIAAVKRALERDPTTLPVIERRDPPPNGAAATTELLKVLLRMCAEKHAVAAKVIATTDDLERIAAESEPDVAALHGWRREVFGDKALKLKAGQMGLALEKGRVVAFERD